MRIGKWAEAKIVFKDTTTGARGITRAPTTLANYVKQFQGRISVPASSTAGTGGTVRVLKATHGLDSIVGAVVTYTGTNPRRATAIEASVVNASTLLISINGYSAATTALDAVIWGTSSA